MTRSTQGGSIRNFIIIAIILVGVLAGGIYVIRQQMPSEPLPEEGVAAEETPAPKEEQPDLVQQLPGSAVAEQLPETGPVESIGAILAVGTVSLVTTAYVRSRRPELSL